MYRGRFGIESSYRMLGQCLARTNSTNERVRLLYVGVALLIGNGWGLLCHHDLLDEETGDAHPAWPAASACRSSSPSPPTSPENSPSNSTK